jgi:hypothetical protein
MKIKILTAYATLAISSLMWFGVAHSKNIQLSPNKENCEKIGGYSQKYIDGASDSIGLPNRSLNFIGAKEIGYLCYVIFTTPKGVYNCHADMILSSDEGVTAFAATIARPNCEISK